MKAFIGFLVAVLSIIIVVSGSLACDVFHRRDLVLPRTVLGDMSLSGMTRSEVKELIRGRVKEFMEQKWKIAARGNVASVSLQDMGVVLDEDAIVDQVPFAGGMSNPEIVLWSVAGRRVFVKVVVEKPEILRVIEEKFPDIPKTKNAAFVKKGKNIEIIEGQSGVEPQADSLIEQIKTNIAFLEQRPLAVEFKTSVPTVTAEDLEKNRKEIMENFPKKITLKYEQNKWAVDFEKHPEWILFDRAPYGAQGARGEFLIRWDPVSFSQFLGENISKTVEQLPEGTRIWRDENQKIQFEGHGDEGRSIEIERLLALVDFAIENGQTEVDIPVAVVPPKIEVSDDLKKLGIRDLVAVGHTRFAGSPANRMHNIGVGVAHFNGMLIPAGETFSFGNNLGTVDGSTGYRKELVIKPEGTIPEFGGGLCQVSTTLYRSAIYAGLPIVDRAPHSYVVTYYSQVGGHGLDATVYPPSRDLKFTNDTPGDLLIHSYVEGINAYFKLYGTLDGRKVSLEGPYISNRKAPPAETIFVPDPTLQPGEKKQVEKPHGGFDTLWYRYITKNGETTREEIISHYKAVPAKFLVGGEITPEGENKGLENNANVPNPFE